MKYTNVKVEITETGIVTNAKPGDKLYNMFTDGPQLLGTLVQIQEGNCPLYDVTEFCPCMNDCDDCPFNKCPHNIPYAIIQDEGEIWTDYNIKDLYIEEVDWLKVY